MEQIEEAFSLISPFLHLRFRDTFSGKRMETDFLFDEIDTMEEEPFSRTRKGRRRRAIIISGALSFDRSIERKGKKVGTSLESQLGADFFSVGRRVFLLSYLFRLVNVALKERFLQTLDTS